MWTWLDGFIRVHRPGSLRAMAADVVNPFQVLTFIVAPAILTNAGSIMALGTSNRFARAIDRARELSGKLEANPDDPRNAGLIKLLGYTQTRAKYLVRALTAFYLAVGSFAAASLSSLLGAGLASAGFALGYSIALGVALVAGMTGVGGLIVGSGLLVAETRLTLRVLFDQTSAMLERTQQGGDAGSIRP